MKHLGDITKISGRDAPIVNVIIGGSPCQDLSVAGKRAGLSGERSGLFMEQIRIIKEMREKDAESGRTGADIRPRFMVWENVPGAFSVNGGRDFAAVLEETAKVADKEIPDIHVPKNGWSNSGCIMGRGFSIAWRVLDAQFFGVPQRRRRIALIADFAGGAAPEILFERESVSGHSEPCEAERKGTAGDAADCTGTAISFLERAGCAFGETGIGYWKEGIKTLRAEGENRPSRPSNVVVHEKVSAVCYESHHMDARYREMGDVCETICSRYGTGGGNMPIAVDCYNQYISEISMTLNSAATDSDHIPCVMKKNTVRRLTPTECERLQGYPDGWTDIGDWIDSKGKKHKAADSPRYKALGNSIAIPTWLFVLSRLNEYCEDKTMASLFDGIGGFPLIWEFLNGTGSAVWCSEIEEFPIAVTKLRFPEREET